jgi:phosphoribosylanthranilate isomerase
MKLKVCGLKDPANIEAVLQLSPDYIGFIFYAHSRRYVDDRNDLATYSRSVKGTKKVGVFVNESLEQIRKIIDLYGLDEVQLHGAETAGFCAAINKTMPVIKSFQIDAAFNFDTLNAYEYSCASFLFDAATKYHGGSGRSFDWRLLEKYTLSKSFLLSGGISLENIDAVKKLQHPAMTGIDVNSCFETEPALKDISKLKALLHEIRN